VAATFTPDGRHLAVFHTAGNREVFPLDDSELVALLSSKVVRDITPAECTRYGLSEEC
jgi:hypothetical protein